MLQITANFSTDELLNAIADFEPARVELCGDTKAKQRENVVRNASNVAVQFMAGEKGSVGKLAREQLQSYAGGDLVKACFNANYRPLAEVLAVKLGRSIILRKRADYDALPSMIQGIIADIKAKKNRGYRVDSKGVEVPTTEHANAMMCLQLVESIREGVDAAYAARTKTLLEQREVEAETE